MNLIDTELAQEETGLVEILPHEQRVIESRLGYEVEVKDKTGNWLQQIIIPDDIGKVNIINTNSFFTGNINFDEVTSSLLSYLIKRYMGGTICEYEKGIDVVTSHIKQGINLQRSIEISLSSVKNASQLKAIKTLSQWLIIYELENYSFDFHHEVMKLSFGTEPNKYSSLFTLDAELGPFTKEEMEILQRAITNPHIHLEDRVVLCLFITFGLRPIQISLLKQSDFKFNERLGLHYLNIPRVKQNQKERRADFTRRLLSEDLATMIKTLIDTHKQVYSYLDLKDPPLIMRRIKGFIGASHPYRVQLESERFFDSELDEFRQPVANQKYLSYYERSGKLDDGYHLSNQGITFRLLRRVDLS